MLGTWSTWANSWVLAKNPHLAKSDPRQKSSSGQRRLQSDPRQTSKNPHLAKNDPRQKSSSGQRDSRKSSSVQNDPRTANFARSDPHLAKGLVAWVEEVVKVCPSKGSPVKGGPSYTRDKKPKGLIVCGALRRALRALRALLPGTDTHTHTVVSGTRPQVRTRGG